MLVTCVVLALCSEEAAGQIPAMPPSDPMQILPPIDATAPADPSGETTEVLDFEPYADRAARPFDEPGWRWQLLPQGLIYPAYLASGRESRFASQWSRDPRGDAFWDVALGGHMGMLRYGDQDPVLPQGWQIDVEGAAFPRLALDGTRDLLSVDFRFGIPLSLRRGRWESKFAYYHLSSHLADEFLLRDPAALATRINYVRDVLVLGLAVRPWDDLRLYSEAGWAFNTDGGSQPWEFQFGVDWSRVRPTSIWGSPFLALNGRIREEVDFGGNFTAQIGWQWRGEAGRLFRLGFHYFNGKTDQYQFFTRHEEIFALGLWYDY